MSNQNLPDHFVVDGSNIATEGRSMPSLEQLNDAVLAFMKQYPNRKITVVVDATFGHRIPKKERKAFDDAIANNELVAPPAGAIGRGDAFVLTIATQSDAGVLSNDSFQEFHGEHGWLFDDGRLVGGKPVPNVGWVFVVRSPVRGPKSRQAIKQANDGRNSNSGGDPQADKKKTAQRVRKKGESNNAGGQSKAGDDDRSKQTDDKTTSPKRNDSSNRDSGSKDSSKGDSASNDQNKQRLDSSNSRSRTAAASGTDNSEELEPPATPPGASDSDEFVNELMPFLDFVQVCPAGTKVNAVIESYSSHGAYAVAGNVLIYLPLKYMDDPPPRSPRKVVTIGEQLEVFIVGFTPDRRSVDAALAHMAQFALKQEGNQTATLAKVVTDLSGLSPQTDSQNDDSGVDDSGVDDAGDKDSNDKDSSEKKPAPSRRRSTAKATSQSTAKKKTSVTKQAAAVKPKPAAKTTGKKKQAARKTAAKKASAPAKKKALAAATATKQAAATGARKSATKKPAGKPSPAKKPVAKKAAAKQSPTKKTPAKKSTAKKSGSQKTAAQAPTKKAAAKPQPTTPSEPKVRIHQLSKQLGLSNAEVLALCSQLGLPATSHSSSLTADHADLVRTAAGAK